MYMYIYIYLSIFHIFFFFIFAVCYLSLTRDADDAGRPEEKPVSRAAEAGTEYQSNDDAGNYRKRERERERTSE